MNTSSGLRDVIMDMDKENLKKQIADLIEMEHRSGSMEVCSPLYISRMLNVPLEKVEAAMREMRLN